MGMLLIGVVIGGAAMYYIQPSVQTFVAKAFGWEASLYNQLTARAAAVKASATNTKAS